MKKFAFSLQYLLDAHLAKEQAAEHELQTAMADLRSAEAGLRDLEKNKNEQSECLAQMRGVVRRADFASYMRNIGAIHHQFDAMRKEIQGLEKRVSDCREKMKKEMVARKIQENLREREREEWLEALQHEEQTRMDETAVTRWSRREH